MYCPPGLEIAAWEPTFVSVGYYTTGGDEKTNRTRWAQTICPLGHYCTIGKRIRCKKDENLFFLFALLILLEIILTFFFLFLLSTLSSIFSSDSSIFKILKIQVQLVNTVVY